MHFNFLTFLTVFVCATCVYVYIHGRVYFWSKARKVEKDLSDSKGKTIQNISSSSLKKALENYSKSFQGKTYTTEYASDYVNLDSVSEAFGINMRVVNVLPNILTSLGILGTFVGLTAALLNFNSGTTEEIRNSIDSLLDGMGTAFITSVFGMAFSGAFLFKSKRRTDRLSCSISDYASSMDNIFHRSTEQVILDSFYQKAQDGTSIAPSMAFGALQETVSKMKTTIDQLGSDICDSIGEAMDKSFNNDLKPIIDSLTVKLENPAQAVTDSLIAELSNVCNNFKDSLTKSVNDQMNDLIERFIDASNAINTIPDTIALVNSSLQESAKETVETNKSLSEALGEEIMRLTDLSDSFNSSIGRLGESTRALSSVHDQLMDMPQTLHQAADAISASTDNLTQSNNSIGDTLISLETVNKNTSDAVNSYTDRIDTIQKGLAAIFNDISLGLTQYSDAAKAGLQTMLDPFTTSITTATEKVANSIAPLSDAVDDLSTFGDTVNNTLASLQAALAPLQKTLDKINEAVKKSSTLNNI